MTIENPKGMDPTILSRIGRGVVRIKRGPAPVDDNPSHNIKLSTDFGEVKLVVGQRELEQMGAGNNHFDAEEVNIVEVLRTRMVQFEPKSMEIDYLWGHPRSIKVLAVSWDQSYLLSGDASLGGRDEHSTLRITELQSNRVVGTVSIQFDPVTDAVFSLGGQLLITCDACDQITVWDTNTFRNKKVLVPDGPILTEYRLSRIAISPNGKTVIAAGEQWEDASQCGVVAIGLTSSESLSSFFTQHFERVMAVCFSPCGEMVCSGSKDGVLLIWMLASLEEVGNLQGHTGAISFIVWSHNNKIASIDDHVIILWDPSTGVQYTSLDLKTHAAHHNFKLEPQHRFLVMHLLGSRFLFVSTTFSTMLILNLNDLSEDAFFLSKSLVVTACTGFDKLFFGDIYGNVGVLRVE